MNYFNIMSKILVVVESPGKIKKISKILGKNHRVVASSGIFRDLDNKKMSIDFEDNFKPIYVFTKPNIVKSLKSAMKGVDMLYIASDLDLEGDGIAQSIYDVLKPKKYKRLIFNKINKKAINDAIAKGGNIDKNRVAAQKARRVLDRLYGYMISPLVQKKIGGFDLSAGRVQSVATEIVINKEDDIINFIEKNKSSTFFKVKGEFQGPKSEIELKSTLMETSDSSSKPLKGKPVYK